MRTEDIYDDLYQYLWKHLSTDNEKYFGGTTDEWVHFVTKAWLNDASNSKHRYHDMYKNLGKTKVKNSRILDISSGCGTFVFYGLLNGMNVYGIEPEHWKNTFNSMKVDAYNYPESWKYRFIASFGENLPFKDNQFDIISSYQTLEHVQDVKKVLSEMIRCIKRRGAIFLKAPDLLQYFRRSL